ncbi:hypothetical protein GV792_04905 [Nocardia cyriacigeorgica]|uniref:hypothetical protein n=1 Tax=Nocardia cyriacigeorgica TaxID=135487 RepID=UPI0013B9D6ED|nr:hypothetical protein [Nocardia cyriacigeorgica]NEW49383.1 hypothetical protein [Nocardia cyriacigeorgica]
MTAIEPGQIWLDTRGRYLRVDEITDQGQAVMVVVAQLVGDRVMAPMRAVSMDVAKVSKRMTLVDSAPQPTGPDIANLTIDYRDQTIVLGAGPVPYYVGSSGPRVRLLDGGAALVTVTFYAGHIHTIYGGAQ